jgi:hypothetical protein
VAFYGYPREVVIRFVTNNRLNYRGFRASYVQLPCPESVPFGRPAPYPSSNSRGPPYQSSNSGGRPISGVASSGSYPISVVQDSSISRVPCDLVVHDMMFEITSPNYPNSYPSHSDCLYSIRKANQNVCKLRLKFVSFDVYGDKECKEDYLEIYNNRMCGRLPNNTISK